MSYSCMRPRPYLLIDANTARRTNLDLVYWFFQTQQCTNDPYCGFCCAVPSVSLRVARTKQDGCGMTSFGYYEINGCHKIVTLGDGTWYYLDNCDEKANWQTGKAGTAMGKLRTYEGQYEGECYYAGHVRKDRICPGFYTTTSFSDVRCTVSFWET
jgi:hypothetical protein